MNCDDCRREFAPYCVIVRLVAGSSLAFLSFELPRSGLYDLRASIEKCLRDGLSDNICSKFAASLSGQCRSIFEIPYSYFS